MGAAAPPRSLPCPSHSSAWTVQSKSPKGTPVALFLGGHSVLPTCSDCWGHFLPKVCVQSSPGWPGLGAGVGQSHGLGATRSSLQWPQEGTVPAHPQPSLSLRAVPEETAQPEGSDSGTRPALTPHRQTAAFSFCLGENHPWGSRRTTAA